MPPRYFADTAFWIALFRSRDQHHHNAVAWQGYLLRTGTSIITTEAVCWEWLNAMSGAATRRVAAQGFDRVRHDPRIEIVPHDANINADALRLFAARPDKDWSLTDCLSFIVMGRKSVGEALTVDNHFEQAGFRAVLGAAPPNL